MQTMLNGDFVRNPYIEAAWARLINEGSLIGRDFHSREGHDIFRGPIKSIELREGKVFITLEWCAVGGAEGFWIAINMGNPFCFMATDMPTLACEELVFRMPGLGTGTIEMQEGNKLDPSRVLGLKDLP